MILPSLLYFMGTAAALQVVSKIEDENAGSHSLFGTEPTIFVFQFFELTATEWRADSVQPMRAAHLPPEIEQPYWSNFQTLATRNLQIVINFAREKIFSAPATVRDRAVYFLKILERPVFLYILRPFHTILHFAVGYFSCTFIFSSSPRRDEIQIKWILRCTQDDCDSLLFLIIRRETNDTIGWKFNVPFVTALALSQRYFYFACFHVLYRYRVRRCCIAGYIVLHTVRPESSHPQRSRTMEQLAPGVLPRSSRALPRQRLSR